jgi:cation diffusion facilitator family transporter
MIANKKESLAIKLSIWGSVIIAFTGIIASIYSNSISLLFDALYTLIAMIISIAGLRISKLLQVKFTARFNFGFYSFEPLFVFINGSLLMVLAILLFVSSIQTIIQGGRIIELSVVTEYLLFSFVLCTSLLFILRYYGKITKSEIVITESVTWMLDAIISIVVFSAFILTLWLQHTNYRFLIPYLDPGITIILILCFINQPIQLLKSGLFDLLLAAPPQAFIDEVKEKLYSNKLKYGFSDIEIHAAKIGRAKSIEVICYYEKTFEIKNIELLELLQNEMKEEVESYSHDLIVKIRFTILKNK